jgi:flagellin-like protein
VKKAITPVVSVILLIMLTIVASVGAYFFITSSVNDYKALEQLKTRRTPTIQGLT